MTVNAFQQISYDGNAALKMGATEAPPQPERVQEKKKASASAASASQSEADPKPKRHWKTAPVAVGTILLLAAFMVLILISYAQMVMINDQVVELRGTLSDLQTEETKLMAQYELAYDLQEIEKQMLASGQMTKIQSWQTYTLELSEPDSVEYYHGSDLKEQMMSFAKNLVTAIQEYF